MRPYLVVAFGLLASLAAAESPQVLFSSKDNIQSSILYHIAHANRTIDAAVFDITSTPLRRALRDAAGRGVTVRVLTDRRHVKNAKRFEDPFLSDLELRLISGRSRRGAMHEKFVIFDGEGVMTGSYNWTPGAQHANYETVIFQEEDSVARAYAEEFDTLWNRSLPVAFVTDKKKPRHKPEKYHYPK